MTSRLQQSGAGLGSLGSPRPLHSAGASLALLFRSGGAQGLVESVGENSS